MCLSNPDILEATLRQLLTRRVTNVSQTQNKLVKITGNVHMTWL